MLEKDPPLSLALQVMMQLGSKNVAFLGMYKKVPNFKLITLIQTYRTKYAD